MKYAIISDIHGNVEALKVALKYIQSQDIKQIICLGDVVGYGPCPNECVELVKKHASVCLMGNHDHAALGRTDISYFNEYAKEAVLWTREKLTEKNKKYLEELPFTAELENMLFVHSTPRNPEDWQYIFSEEDARYHLDYVKHQLVFIGHSHMPAVFPYNGRAFYEEQIKLDYSDNNRYVVNVGSVGQPRDGDPRSCMVIFDDQYNFMKYIRLDYPIEKTSQQIFDRQLPPFLAFRLRLGQ